MLSKHLKKFLNSKKNSFLFGDYIRNYSRVDSNELIKKFLIIIGRNGKKKLKKQLGIAIYLPRDANYFLAIFSIWLSGNYFIPLNQLWPEKHLKKILNHSKPDLIISDRKIFNFKKVYKILYLKDILIIKDDNKQIFKREKISDKNIAYIIYTSGSTGTQKGVIITRENFNSYLNWVRKYLKPQVNKSNSLLVTSEMTFDLVLGDLANALAFDSTIYITPETNNIIKAFKMIIEKKIDTIYGVPSTLNNIFMFSKLRKKKELKNLKNILSGGDVFTPNLLKLIKNECPTSKIFNVYGPTELTINVLCQNLSNFKKNKNDQIPIGFGFNHLDYKFYDKDKKVFNNSEGELVVSGKQSMLGYLKDPKRTKMSFIKHRNKNYYRTGDLFYKKKNIFYYTGRFDRQVKIKGYRINLNSLDNFFNKLDIVREVKTILIENTQKIKKIFSFIVVKNNNKKNSLKELEKKTQNFFPSYICPNKIFILKKLPYNANGKLDEKKLKILV